MESIPWNFNSVYWRHNKRMCTNLTRDFVEIYKLFAIRYKLINYSPAGKSLLAKTVLKTEGTVFPIRTDLGWWITFLFFSSNFKKFSLREPEWFTAFQNSCIFLLLIFSCFVSVKAVGEGSGNSESASGINLPLFTYEINK